MREGQVTYKTKLRELKAQYKLYDKFLVQEKPSEDNRYKLINEMGRISILINQIENMTVGEFFGGADDYLQKFESKINKNCKYLLKNYA